MTQPSGFCPLTHEGVLAVRGADAEKFLQGQLTCNLAWLKDGSSSLGGRCNLKGRLISTFRILPESDGFLLAMAAELVPVQLEELKKYAQFFRRCALLDESLLWQRFGLLGADSGLPEPLGKVMQGHEQFSIRLDNQRSELWRRTDSAEPTNGWLQLSLDSWRLAQIRAGIGQVFGQTSGRFIPQMLNLPAVGGVSFKKGCYTGQEIVARMQYRGQNKRRLYRLHAQTGQIPPIGSLLADNAGEVVLAAPADDGCELLAVLSESAVAQSHLQLADGTALNLLDLPYRLDRDLEIQR
ncbi:aminomethyltransferase [Ventosimonas gracilis]|uniref:Aminomethyltransferase n=1 Tax=Ventosimonas gracilis TaxID=1680762 RepID=A0A139SX22_9GAMM|nr:folate-binding protein YgfZ [Ventosimonas gracilis]KXU39054.1 aminomethyltransferase [Ventosimonas gracilis]